MWRKLLPNEGGHLACHFVVVLSWQVRLEGMPVTCVHIAAIYPTSVASLCVYVCVCVCVGLCVLCEGLVEFRLFDLPSSNY